MAKESLQRAAIARIAAGKRSKNVRRHSLDRLHASMIKQKIKPCSPMARDSTVGQLGTRSFGRMANAGCVKNHMGCNYEVYDAECATLARALAEATRRQTAPERVTIFTDAQAAIRRLASEEAGPGQKYAIQARRHIAALRKARPSIDIEIRWCPSRKGVPGN